MNHERKPHVSPDQDVVDQYLTDKERLAVPFWIKRNKLLRLLKGLMEDRSILLSVKKHTPKLRGNSTDALQQMETIIDKMPSNPSNFDKLEEAILTLKEDSGGKDRLLRAVKILFNH